MNSHTVTGNLTRDPELKNIGNDKKVCNFSLAVNRKFKDREGNRVVDFFPIVFWGKLAELAQQYLTKGSKCLVRGETQLRKYEKDGVQHLVVEIIGDELEFLSSNQAPKQDTFSPQIVIEETDLATDESDCPF